MATRKRPAKKPAERPAKRRAKKPAERPAKRLAKKPAERPAKRQAKRLAKKPAERLAKRRAKKPAKKPAERPAKRQAKRLAKKPAERSAMRRTKKPAERSAKRQAKRLAKKPAERSAKRQAKRLAKKPAGTVPFSASAKQDAEAIKRTIRPPAKAYSHVHQGGADVLVIYPPLADRDVDRKRMIRDVDELSALPLRCAWWIRAGISVMVDTTENEEDYHKKGGLWQKDIYTSPRPLSEPGMALNALWGEGGIVDRNQDSILGHLLLDISTTPDGGRPDR